MLSQKSKSFVLLLTLVLMGVSGAAKSNHQINLSSDRATVNSTIQLGPSEKATTWRLDWSIPSQAEILSVQNRFSEARVEDRSGSNLVVVSKGPPRNTDVVNVIYEVPDPRQKIFKNLSTANFQLPGFQGQRTSGLIRSREIISWKLSEQYRAQKTDTGLRFEGEGPVNIRVKLGDGSETEHFEFFGPTIDGAEPAYKIAVGTTGQRPDFRRFPVAVMPDQVYDRQVNSWSAGEYVNGKISVRSTAPDYKKPGLIAHELVHGLNDRSISWAGKESSYIDEGTAEFIEYLVNIRHSSVPPRQVFGNETRYDPQENDSTYSVLDPKGSKQRLWEYYRENKSFMKDWSPSKPENREFGYAYSQLIIMNHAMNNSLSATYNDLKKIKIGPSTSKWERLSKVIDLTPCKTETKERFERCLERVNSHNYTIKYYKGDSNFRTETVNPSNNFTVKINRRENSRIGLLGRIRSFLIALLGEIK